MILLACGGRTYHDRAAVFQALDRVHAKRPVTLLVHGGAAGADSLAADWARERGIACRSFTISKHEWRVNGRAAGPMRNARMLAEARPDGVVAFPGGAGTADMVRQARAAGVPVWRPAVVCGAAQKN